MEQKLSPESKSVRAIKLFCFILLLPVFLGLAKGFTSEVLNLPFPLGKLFFLGAGLYLTFHIFIVEPLKFYKKTQRFIQLIFGFFSPILRVSYYLIPFWALISLLVYLILTKLLHLNISSAVFFFITGFVFTMHITLVARIMRTDDITKFIDYLFIIIIVLVINIFFLAFNLKIYENTFSISSMAKYGLDWGIGVAKSIFNQLFIP